MKHALQRLLASIAPLFGMVAFVVIFIVGLFVFSYLLIVVALIGLVLFIVAFIRSKITRKKHSPHTKSQGRVIEHDQFKEK